MLVGQRVALHERGSLPKPVVFSTANVVPGTASRIRPATSQPDVDGDRPGSCARRGPGRRTRCRRWSRPPARGRRRAPTASRIHRIGRPVTNTTVTPRSSTAVSAARVRAVTVPSVCSSVPSRSVATSLWHVPKASDRRAGRAHHRSTRCSTAGRRVVALRPEVGDLGDQPVRVHGEERPPRRALVARPGQPNQQTPLPPSATTRFGREVPVAGELVVEPQVALTAAGSAPGTAGCS